MKTKCLAICLFAELLATSHASHGADFLARATGNRIPNFDWYFAGAFFVFAITAALSDDNGGRAEKRIREHIEERGGKLLSAFRTSFGNKWGTLVGEDYDISYTDREGSIHDAMCEVSMMSGITITKDRIIRHAEKPEQPPIPPIAPQ